MGQFHSKLHSNGQRGSLGASRLYKWVPAADSELIAGGNPAVVYKWHPIRAKVVFVFHDMPHIATKAPTW